MRPVTSVCAPSVWATTRASILPPLNRKLELRAITFRSGSGASALIKPSLIPSERYSLSGVALSLTNGITAMECASFTECPLK